MIRQFVLRMVTFLRAEQLLKALSPMVVTDAGMSMLLIPQPSKALIPMVSIVLGNFTDESAGK